MFMIKMMADNMQYMHVHYSKYVDNAPSHAVVVHICKSIGNTTCL